MNTAGQLITKPKLLIVDDETTIRKLLGEGLGDEYEIFLASDAGEAFRLAVQHRPEVILLDIYMPGEDGVDLCKRLRDTSSTKDIPVIMMTAMNARDTRIRSFHSGADDFLAKPFDLDELNARLQSKIRRAGEKRPGRLTFQNIVLDVDSLKVTVDEKPLDLGVIEFKILSLMVRQAGALVRREDLETTIWGDDRPASRSLDTHIANLRKKLGESRAVLRTVYGEGFILEAKVP
jgi:two-component system, OmpR family, phosphate regulon response regulator PhoB